MIIDKRQLAVMVGAFCAFTNLYAIQALLPELMRVFDASARLATFAVGVNTLAVALMAPFMGMISDRLGRKPVMAGSLALLAVFTLLCARSASMEALIVWRFLTGLCVPGIFTVLIAYIHEEWDPLGALQTTAFYISGTVLGGFSGRFIAGWAGEHFGWQGAFVTLGLLDVLLLPVLILWLPASRHFQPGAGFKITLRNMAGHLRNPRLLKAYGIGCCMLFSLVAVFTFVTLYLAQPPFSLGVGSIGSIFAVYLLGVVATPIASRLVPRFGRVRVTVGALAVGLLGLVATLLPSLPVVVAGLALFSTGLFIVQGINTAFVPSAAVGSSSAAVGLYVACYYTGGSLGAVLPSQAWLAFGWAGCVALICAVQVLMAGLCVWLWRRETRLGGAVSDQSVI